jgi:hypothetical protein
MIHQSFLVVNIDASQTEWQLALDINHHPFLYLDHQPIRAYLGHLDRRTNR